jgi:hypothetical protein
MSIRCLPCFAIALSVLAGAAAHAGDLPPNWPMAPSELERRFANDPFTIKEVKGAGGGVTGASKVLLEYADGKTLKAKWKEAPEGDADGWNNCPRKELAVYEIQRWIYDENDFIIPTTTPRCIPIEGYRLIDKEHDPTIPGTSCVLGMLAVWMENVTAPGPQSKLMTGYDFYQKKRFRSDPAYAAYLSDFNVLLYLVNHRDGRKGNLLLSTVPGDPRVFAVDNGIAFEPFPWNFLVRNWFRIRVPWVRKETIERLRSVDAADYDRLGVLVEMQRMEDGMLQDVRPTRSLNTNRGARWQDGRLQLGLSRREIGNVRDRIEELLEEVDEGDIDVR